MSLDTLSELSNKELDKAKNFKAPKTGYSEKPADFNLLESRKWFNKGEFQNSISGKKYFDKFSNEAIKSKKNYLANEKLMDEIHAIDNTDGLLRILKKLDTEEGMKFIKDFDINIENITNSLITPISAYIDKSASRDSRYYSVYEKRHLENFLDFLDTNKILNETQKIKVLSIFATNNNDYLREDSRRKFPSESRQIDDNVVNQFVKGKKINLDVLKNFSGNYYQKVLFNNENFQNYLIVNQENIKSDILIDIDQKIEKINPVNYSSYEIEDIKKNLKNLPKNILEISNKEKSDYINKIYEPIIHELQYKIDRKILNHLPDLTKELFSVNLGYDISSTEYIQKERQRNGHNIYKYFSDKFINEFIDYKDFIKPMANINSLLTSNYRINSLFNYENYKKIFDSANPEDRMKKTAISYELFNDLIYSQKNNQTLFPEEETILKNILDYKGNEALDQVIGYAENKKARNNLILITIKSHPEYVAENVNIFKEKLDIGELDIKHSAEKVIRDSLSNGNINSVLKLVNFIYKFDIDKNEIINLVEESLSYEIESNTTWRIDDILKHKNELFVKDENIANSAAEACKMLLSRADVNGFLGLMREKDKFFLKENDIKKALLAGIFTSLSQDHFDEIFSLPKEYLQMVEKEYRILEFQDKIGLPSQKIYNEFCKYKNEKDSAKLSDMIKRLNKISSSLRSELLSDKISAKELNDDYARKYLAYFVRFDDSQWGRHGDIAMTEIVENHNIAKMKGEILSLNENYKPSENIFIDRVNLEKQDEFKYSQPFVERYQTIVNSLRESFLLLRKKNH